MNTTDKALMEYIHIRLLELAGTKEYGQGFNAGLAGAIMNNINKDTHSSRLTFGINS